MCGIVYELNTKGYDVTKHVLDTFNAQRLRGTTSFGFYLPLKDRMVHNVHERRTKTLLKRTKGHNSEVLFHHRFATSTPDVRNACHPFSTKQYFGDNQYIGVHNGIIWNDYEIETEHKKLGIKYISTQPDKSFNDSEALLYDLARYFEGQTEKITARGSVAFVVIKRVKGKKKSVLFGRNYQSPLMMLVKKNSLTLSSEGKGKPIEVNTLYEYDYKTRKITTKPMELPTPYTSITYSSGTTYGNDYHGYRGEINDDDENYYNYDSDTWGRKWQQSLLPAPKTKLRYGNFFTLKEEFLKENYGKYHNAAVACALERDDMLVQCDDLAAEIETYYTVDSTTGTTVCSNDKTANLLYCRWLALCDYVDKLDNIKEDLFAVAGKE